jgi:uncharacterized protein (DUF2147 family)
VNDNKQLVFNILKNSFALLLLSLIFPIALQAQSPVGLWKTIDDESGEAKSHIKIYKEDGKLYGEVEKFLKKSGKTHCEKCPEPHKGKPILGLRVIWDLEKSGDEWTEGEIMDPVKGKIYRCTISLDGKDTLKVRGYLGFSVFGRTQEWSRVK